MTMRTNQANPHLFNNLPATLLVWIGIAVLVTNLVACQRLLAPKVETITIGLPALEQNALLYIADQQGLFTRNGLKVVIKDYDSGLTTMNSLLMKEIDIAGVSEYPFVREVFNENTVVLLSSIDKFENDFIIGRKDRGIQTAADLHGKRIGVTLGTINEFYLGRFLQLNGIEQNAVSLVDVKPAHFASALQTGQVDALVAWQPHIHQIEQEVPDVVIWPAQSSQMVYGLLVSRQEWLTENTGSLARLLKSLVEAEGYLIKYPGAAQLIVKNRLKYDEDYMAAIWPQHQFALTLDHSLIVAMTAEARWLMDTQRVNTSQAPDFLESIYLDGLKAIKPEVVDINR